MGKTIDRGVLVHDGRRRKDPEEELYKNLTRKMTKDMVMVPTLIWQALNFVVVEGKEEGLNIQEDILTGLSRGAAVPVKYIAQQEAFQISRDVAADAATILKNCKADNAKEATIAAAYFVAHLVEEQVLADPGSMGVLCSMHILEDSKQDDVGNLWPFDKHRIPKIADNIREKARHLGYF